MKEKHKQIIEKWISQSWQEKLYLKSDDLHIDEIDVTLKGTQSNPIKNAKKWISRGIEFLIVADQIREKLKIPLFLFLFINFEESKNKVEFNENFLIKPLEPLSNTPPSLYLFDKEYFLIKSIKNGKYKKNTLHFNEVFIYFYNSNFFQKEENLFTSRLVFFTLQNI